MNEPYIIAGVSKGIGRKIAELLIADGKNVIGYSRTGEGPDGLMENRKVDVLNDELPNPDGKIAGLVYLPGTINLKPFKQLKMDDFREDIDINYMGAVRFLQHFYPHMRKDPSSSIVLISTVAVQQGMPFHASVAGAKGALEGLTRALAAEWAPNIRVNAIAPSLTDTDMASRMLNNDRKRERMDERHPLKRVGQPSDIAQAAVLLLTERGSWISGQVIGVDGGMSTIRLG